MNKRGFTLIEMIAVIVILSLMAIIVETNITKIVKKSKNDLSSVQEKLIIQAGKMWASDNMDDIPDYGCTYVTLNELIEAGIINDISMIPDSINRDAYYVKICSLDNGVGVQKLNYSIYNNNDYIGCFSFGDSSIVEYCDNVDCDDRNPACPKDIVIPKKINGEDVTVINSGAFMGKKLTSVVIPNGVTYIASDAFSIN